LPAKSAPKKPPAKTPPRKAGRGKRAAKSQAPKVKPRKSTAKKPRAKVQEPKVTRKRPTAQELKEKLLATVLKQRAEQEAAAKFKPPAKVQKPKPPPKPPAKPIVKNRVYIIQTADTRGYTEGKEPEKDRVRVSSHGNKQIKDFHKVFAGAFKGALRSTPFDDADDAPISRYGISFRVPEINNMNLAKASLREWLNLNLPPHASAHLVEEDSSISVHLNFGKYDDQSLASEAARDLKKQTRFIRDAMDKTRDFTDYTDDYIWFAFWDWDDDITDY
jgi:hypothetical protein